MPDTPRTSQGSYALSRLDESRRILRVRRGMQSTQSPETNAGSTAGVRIDRGRLARQAFLHWAKVESVGTGDALWMLSPRQICPLTRGLRRPNRESFSFYPIVASMEEPNTPKGSSHREGPSARLDRFSHLWLQGENLTLKGSL